MTRQFGLIGHPLGHSKSPVMHEAAYKDMGLDAVYCAYDISPQELGNAIRTMKAQGIDGFNVTIPHKVAIIDYLDEIDEDAEAMGAVNTVVCQDGRWVGKNTDADGYIESLLPVVSDQSLTGRRVLVIGAGGAARAVIHALGKQRATISVSNRTAEKAQELAQLFSHLTIEAIPLNEAESTLGTYDVLINTTSVGMYPDTSKQPIALDRLKQATIVSDLIYNPYETALLQEAKQRGNRILNGIGMFVNQGALSIEHWTGRKPNRKCMEHVVRMHLT
ncbi:shikimate dehydrogenase [Shouchella clausii]|jgi:shikimate dehydrogenase|uniref:shikimate dehydrogenase n=1 Tax=Shouchella TaxID=2893057 RepID=UPI0004E6B523|nr:MULTISPECIES: shikimate dehydrogenase [Shouchella]MCM3312408.1 shikimate dehydrogenase [Psychrobacillus sp. MER TA 17]ALA51197.1 Shikimate 5-dehydrogenase I alpha [Shouchella clausii]KKI85003.1 hypothetical protein WZ76_17765 [Shouchella clausii]MBU3231988.1 shikimate dehydrogenase [Shouchella clausii]MBU3264728.1 shikimate dehydrogenase [Shouchella clausii]